MTEETTNKSGVAALLVRLLVGSRVAGSELSAGDEKRYLSATFVGALFALAVSIQHFGLRVVLLAVTAMLSALVTELLFAAIRRKPASGGGMVFALVFALMLPVDCALWMVVLGAVVGTIFGKEVFGGCGFQIFAPALVAKGFLVFSYPTAMKGACFASCTMADGLPATAWTGIGLVMIAALLLMAWARPQNLRIIAAAMLASICVGTSLQQAGLFPFESLVEMFLSDAFLFGIVFIACDPAISPRDNEAKWLYGLFIGAIAVLMRSFSTYSEAMLSAILVANVFAPTLDCLSDVSLKRSAE